MPCFKDYIFLFNRIFNNPDKAITDIRLYIAEKGERPLEDIDRVITDSTDKTYVESVMSFATGDKYDSISKLLEAGYTDVIKKDMNAGTAAGKYIYVGMKRTADINNAMYGLLATTEYGKNPPETRGSHTLVSKDDLNKNTNIGKYIYLYQSKTKQLLDTYPITDINAVGKSYKVVEQQEATGETIYVNGGIGAGDVTYKEEFVLNQNGSKQDMNQGAAGDYIYLVMTRELKFEPELYFLGSMLGTGSIVVIGLFLVVAVGATVYVKRKKKRENIITETVNYHY